jgi:hypothetical protein
MSPAHRSGPKTSYWMSLGATPRSMSAVRPDGLEERQRPAEVVLRAVGQLRLVEVHEPRVDRPLRELGVAAPLVPDLQRRVREAGDVLEELPAEGEVALRRVRVEEPDRQPGTGPGEVGEHASHGRHTDAGADEDDGVAAVVEDDVAEREGKGQHVTDLDPVVEQVGHLTVGLPAAVHPLDRELAVLAVVGPGEAVLTRLPDPVGHRVVHRDVLPGKGGLDQPVVDALDDEGDDVVGLPDLLGDPPLPPYRLGSDASSAVETALLVDERVGHQPVDLVPRSRHLRRHGVAEDLHDGGEEVVVHDLVLVGADAQGRVLVRDPVEQLLRELLRGPDEGGREGRDGPGEGDLLGALRLVAPVERAVEKLGVGVEHAPVEAPGDLLDVVGDQRQSRLDDATRTVGQHGGRLPALLRHNHRHAERRGTEPHRYDGSRSPEASRTATHLSAPATTSPCARRGSPRADR